MILSEVDLTRWGERIGREVDVPVFIALRGPLGAGKSVLARGIAHGAGVRDAMPSPTFNLVFRYEGEREVPGLPGVPIEVVHMDLYRLNDPSELWELGWEDLGAVQELILVEWPERAGDLLPEDHWEITLTPTAPGAGFREVSARKVGDPVHLPGFPVTVHSPPEGGEGDVNG
jgi:tRNA threonylcarbamoyladenosine biosynthesis protein TsaE